MPVTGFSPRTDLAIEAHELARGEKHSLVGVEESSSDYDDFQVTRVNVKTASGAMAIGKPVGTYITVDAPGIRRRDPELQDSVAMQLAKEFATLIDVPADASVLIVGLGNSHVTPDALGPLVVERVFVTRHLFQYMPEAIGEGYRTVSAVAPGVLGITGIETSEVVKGIVEHVKPDLVIAVDALASRSLSRVNATIQVANTGIQPGAGVGNKRKALDEESLGVPVIAVGVPTVVDASTIANDSIDRLLNQLKSSVPENGASQIFDQFSAQEKWQMIHEVLEPLGDNLVVTPKEIDEFIEDIAHVVAKGLNLALHTGMTPDDADAVTH
ncbi:GPR endopeptidase [Alicyclobacillus sp. ALC3]|nr:GPR endopeptidase [Alicyclobacillus sp. ALC3]